MLKKHLALFIIAVVTIKTTYAQIILKGTIYDKSTKQPIPFVNISLNKTGTISDIDGNFALKITSLPANIKVSCIGYETIEKTINQNDEKIIIYLTPKTISLPEITVKATENPAHRIIREAIKYRPRNNPEQLNSFSYISYNKLIFTIDKKNIRINIDTLKNSNLNIQKKYPDVNHIQKNDTSINLLSDKIDSFFNKHYLFLSESVTRRTFLYPDNNNEKIIATRTAGIQKPFFFILATSFQSFSFYNDWITIFDKKYLNPISDAAIGRYFYEIKDTLFGENNDTIFVIYFRPLKKALFDGLEGIMQISTYRYAILSIQANPYKQNKGLSIRIQQIYQLIDKEYWFPWQLNTELLWSELELLDKTDTLTMNDSLLLIVKRKIPLIGIGKSYIDSVQINTPLSKKTFKPLQVELSNNAHKFNDTLWFKYRLENFGEKEKNTYHLIDSIGKEAKLDKKLRFIELLLNGYVPVNFINLNITRVFSVNRFQGIRLTLDAETNDRISNYFSTGGYIAYSFNDKKEKYGIRARIKPIYKKPVELLASYSFDVRETGEVAFFDARSFLSSDYYRYIFISNMDYQERIAISFKSPIFKYLNQQLTVSKNTLFLNNVYDFFLIDTTFYDKINYNEVNFQLRFWYKEKFVETFNKLVSIGSSYPLLYANISLGNYYPAQKSYVKYEAKIIYNLDLNIYGKTTFSLVGGYTPSNLPKSLIYSALSSYDKQFPLFIDQSFVTMPMGEFYFKRFLFSFIKHDFKTYLIKIGKLNPGIAIIQNIGIGDLDHSQFTNTKTLMKPYFESGVQCYNIFKQSFNSFGLGVFYRYGNYASPIFKENIYLKMVLSFQF